MYINYKGLNMKSVILILLSIIFTTIVFGDKVAPKKNDYLCKIFTQKATKYKKTMRSDEYAMKTLMSYQHRAKLYCPDK